MFLKESLLEEKDRMEMSLKKINAEKGYWVDNQWWFQNLSIQKYDENSNILGAPVEFQVKEMQDIPETPEDFLIEKNPNHLNISELINITNLKNKTHNHNEYLIVLHQKLSKPFLCIICILISIPVSTQLPRKKFKFKIYHLSCNIFQLLWVMVFNGIFIQS